MILRCRAQPLGGSLSGTAPPGIRVAGWRRTPSRPTLSRLAANSLRPPRALFGRHRSAFLDLGPETHPHVSFPTSLSPSLALPFSTQPRRARARSRSEERRVGKEG